MARSHTPPLSNGSTSSSDDSPLEPLPASQLPGYDVAVASTPGPSAEVDTIATTLKNASLKLCDGPGLSPDERKELDKALNDGIKVGLTNATKAICQLDDLKYHLKLLDLFDRLRQAVHDGTEYFDYPSCHQDAVHIDEPGIDAPPPPYAPVAEPLPDLSSKTGHRPTQEEADQAAAELSQQLLRERRWSIFLNRAAYRLELWCTSILHSDTLSQHIQGLNKTDNYTEKKVSTGFELPDFALPPVDVALMLHSYHLNPLFKEEESQRLRTRAGLSLFNYPLRQIAERAHPTLPILNDVELAKVYWDERITTKRSKQPWDLSLQPPPGHPTNAQETYGGTIFGLRVNCPRCKMSQFVPWTGIGKEPLQVGIGETGWERGCTDPQCAQLISADHLQMRRFLDDYTVWRKSPGRPFTKPVYFMAGTMIGAMHSKRSSRDYFGESLLLPVFKQEKPIEAAAHKDRRVSNSAELQEIDHVAAQCDYSLKKFRQWFEDRWMSNAITPKLKMPDEKAQQMARIAVLMRAYQNGNAAAYGEGLCDVVDAVKRQTSFNLEMEKLGWSKHLKLLDQGALDDVLARSLIRYHKFLDLMASTHTLLTPTLDIDLCWHTHQLQAHYYDHCFRLVGRFVNHDDAIETGILKDAFDRTASLWKQRYGQPYSLCGCMYNSPGAIKKLKSLLGGSAASEPFENASESGKGSGFTTRMKGKWRAAKQLPGDKQDDVAVWQDATHPSAHSAVIVKEEAHRHDKLREQMVKEWAQGKRREGHESAFVFGYNTPGLYPFYYSPLYSTHYVSRGTTGDATHSAYSMYGLYGLMAVSGVGMGAAGAGGFAMAGVGCAGGGGGCGGGGGGCGGGGGS
ncbi:uncharacterized protein UTRI_02010 [Ustilago trichophora]|uniref:Uncharacterized protein n=1 Tax=Ustilago trichophora TaxID=86804 RepID=A0A5C3DYM0_9BASI|nr:uncharacterized protein UTRI_02010 [Ustilago trichophora]